MRQDGHGERGALAGYSQSRFDELFEGVDVVLEVAGEEFADFLIEAVDIGNERQEAEQQHQSYADDGHSRNILSLCLPVLARLLACIGSLYQSQWQVQLGAELFFAPSHLSIVALVIVATQMQDAVEHENFNFFGWGMAQIAGIFRGNLRGDGDFSS